MYPQRYEIDVVTAADGSFTGFSKEAVHGRVLAVQYVKPVSGGFDDGSTMTLTGEETGLALWSEANVNASALRMPRGATHSTAGAAALYAADGTAVLDALPVAAERLKLVVASGGNAKNGKLFVTVG